MPIPVVETPPPVVRRSVFRDVLLALKAQLAALPNLGEDRVLISVDDDVPHYQGDIDVVLKPLDEQPVWEILNSAERVDDRRWRKLLVLMRSRLLIDPADQDIYHLTDINLGHFALEEQVRNALVAFFPTNTAGDSITATNVRVGACSAARRNPKRREWIESSFTLHLQLETALDINFNY